MNPTGTGVIEAPSLLCFSRNVVIHNESLQHLHLFYNDPFWGFFWSASFKYVFLSAWIRAASPVCQVSWTGHLSGHWYPRLPWAWVLCGAGSGGFRVDVA